jgi:hypothetical protein
MHTDLHIPLDLNYKKHSTISGGRYCFLEGLGQFGFREVTLSPLELLSEAYVSVSDSFLHILFVIDACALASTLPSLSLIDTIYCSSETKARPASVQGVGVDFRLKWISLFHNVVKRLPNRTARFRCVFGSTDGYGV